MGFMCHTYMLSMRVAEAWVIRVGIVFAARHIDQRNSTELGRGRASWGEYDAMQ